MSKRGLIKLSYKEKGDLRRYLEDHYTYDPDTGLFYHKKRRGVKEGKEAGSRRPDGHRRISMQDREYNYAALVWFYHMDGFPGQYVRFKDNDVSNVCFSNLYLPEYEEGYSRNKLDLIHSEVCASVKYLKSKGTFTLRKDTGHRREGDNILLIEGRYAHVHIHGVTVQASSLAIFIVTGKWVPDDSIVTYKDKDFKNVKWDNMVLVKKKPLSVNEIVGPEKKRYEGKIYNTTRSGKLIVIEYLSNRNVKVRFLTTGNKKTATMPAIIKGHVLDREEML